MGATSTDREKFQWVWVMTASKRLMPRSAQYCAALRKDALQVGPVVGIGRIHPSARAEF